MYLSVVVPIYKKEKTIKEDLSRINRAVGEITSDYEIIGVVDGIVDDSLEQARQSANDKIKIIGYQTNRGKGYALRYGMARASGQLIAFLDSGMEINPSGLSILLEHLKWYGADAVIGSKRHPASRVDYPFARRATSFVYQVIVLVLFGLKVKDTQTGIKIFRRELLEKVLPRLLVKRYAIDIEILALAHYLGFKKIYEAPVEVTYKFEDLTHASTFKPIMNMLRDTLAVFYRLKILHYYDESHQRQWVFDPELDMEVNLG